MSWLLGAYLSGVVCLIAAQRQYLGGTKDVLGVLLISILWPLAVALLIIQGDF